MADEIGHGYPESALQPVQRSRWTLSTARALLTHSFVRYSTVGAASRGIQTLLLVVLVERMGVHYVASSLIAVGVVHMGGYTVHRFWTFRRKA